MTDFKPGEIVRITIDNARVEEPTDDQGNLEFTYSGDEGLVSFEGVVVSLAEAVKIERLLPAEWPPQAGDLWRDRRGELWFFYRNPYAEPREPALLGRTSGGARWTNDIPVLEVDGNAPWKLVHREEASER